MSWLSCLCGLWAPSDPEHAPLLADSPRPVTTPPRALPRPLNTLAAALFGRGPDPEPQSPLTPLRHSMRHTDDAEFPVSSSSGPERERAAREAAEEQRRKEMLGRQQGLASAYCSRMCKVALPPPTYGSISVPDHHSPPSGSRSRRSTLSRVHFDPASASTDTAATIMPSVIPPTPPHSAALAASVGGFPSPASFATARRRRLSAGSALSHVHVPPIRTQAQIGRGVAHMLFNFGSDSEGEFDDNSSSIVARRVALPPPSPYPFSANASSDYLADAEVDHTAAPVASPSHSPAHSVSHSPTASTLPTPGLGTRSPSLSTDVIPETSEAPGFPGFSGFSTTTLPVTPLTPSSVPEELSPDPSPSPDRKGKGKKRASPRTATSTHTRRPASSSPTISTHERGRPRRRTRRPRDASTSTRETADDVVYKHIGLGALTPTARKRRGRRIVPREY